MAELYNSKLITFLKKNKGRTVKESEAVAASGIDPGKIGPALWQAEPIADPSLKFKATKANIVKARKDGIRWERIARRTDESVAYCKEVGGKEAEDVYVGRGTRGANGNGSAKGKAASGRRQSAKSSATSGRRGKSSGNSGKPTTRARTRAERQAKAGNPK